MILRLFSALAVASVTVSGPAFAGQWDDAKLACAEAVAAEAGVESANYNVKLSKARGGALTRLTVELKASGQTTVIGECKVRRGQVVEVELKA